MFKNVFFIILGAVFHTQVNGFLEGTVSVYKSVSSTYESFNELGEKVNEQTEQMFEEQEKEIKDSVETIEGLGRFIFGDEFKPYTNFKSISEGEK